MLIFLSEFISEVSRFRLFVMLVIVMVIVVCFVKFDIFFWFIIFFGIFCNLLLVYIFRFYNGGL